MEPVNVAYNMDCMEYMRSLPDKAFDLAVVDPPHGDGSQSVNAERERERPGTTASADGGTATRYNRFGQRFDRYKNPAGGIMGRTYITWGRKNRRNLGGKVR